MCACAVTYAKTLIYRGSRAKPSKADFIFVSRCSIRGFVEHSDIPGLGINVSTVDLQCALVTEEAAGVHMGSQEIYTKNGQVALGVKNVCINNVQGGELFPVTRSIT